MNVQYESFKGWKGEAFRGCSPVLVNVQTQEGVAGIHLESKSIRTPSETYYWMPLVISNGFEGAPFINYRLFSKDQTFQTIDWMVQVADSTGDALLKHFSPRAPLLIHRNSGPRLQLCDEQGNPLATRIDVWKDSDSKRNVLKQFNIDDPTHAFSHPALWSLLLSSCDAWFLLS